MSSYKQIIQDTINILSFHRSMGIESYPSTQGILDLLALPTEKPPEDYPRKTAHKPSSASRISAPPTTNANNKSTGTLEEIRAELGDCTRCALHQGRTSILFGSGSPRAKLFIVGEWPSRLEDQTGELFGGAEGEMLDNMLTHVLNLSRDEIYISSIIKCRLPADVQPDPQHIRSCKPFLLGQLAVVQPKVVCAMGPLAAQSLLNTNKALIRLRGHFHEINGIPLMPTFHPSYLLKNPEMKKATLLDLQMIKKKLMEP